MSRRADIEAALKRIDGVSRWVAKRIIDQLPTILSLQVDELAYPKIRAIECRTGWMFGSVTVGGPGLQATITQVLNEQFKDIAEHLRTRLPSS